MFTLGVVDGLRVSELAGRAGVSPSTVRFYERAGLLSPARQAANGYRVFDESALDELAFISRAKGIGTSLEDIVGPGCVLAARRMPAVAGPAARVPGRTDKPGPQQVAEMGIFLLGGLCRVQ